MNEEAEAGAGIVVSQLWNYWVPNSGPLPDLTEYESISEDMWRSHIL